MQFPNRRRLSALRDVWFPAIITGYVSQCSVLFNDNVRVLGSKVFLSLILKMVLVCLHLECANAASFQIAIVQRVDTVAPLTL